MKKAIFVFALATALVACGSNNTVAVSTDSTSVKTDTTAAPTDSTKVDSVEYDGVEHFFGKNRIDTTDLYSKKFFLGFNAGFSNMIIGDLEKNTPSSLYRLQFGYNLDSKYCIFLDGAKGTLESYTPKNS